MPMNRTHMRRQLYKGGGIADLYPRQKYGIGSWVKERARKLIPNELADVAVKAAPFAAPFNPAIAGMMRGIGRFDQRGSMSDALKQGIGTWAGGQFARGIGGAPLQTGNPFTQGGAFTKEGFKSGFSSPLSEGRTQGIKDLFKGKDTPGKDIGQISDKQDLISTLGEKGIDSDPSSLKNIWNKFQELPAEARTAIVGVGSGAIAGIAQWFENQIPQEPGESIDEYMARRKVAVGKLMRQYMDNTRAYDPAWTTMTDEQKDETVAKANMNQGGRVGYQAGGISMGNTLAQNIAANKAQAAANQGVLQGARNTQQATGILDAAMRSADPNDPGGSLTNIYNKYFHGKNTGVPAGTFNMGNRKMTYTSSERDNIIRSMASQLGNQTVSQTNTAPTFNKQASIDATAAREAKAKAYYQALEQKQLEAYGRGVKTMPEFIGGDPYKAEAETLGGMNPGAYMDYLLTGDPQDLMHKYYKDVDGIPNPDYDPQFASYDDIYSGSIATMRTPYDVYYEQQLEKDIAAGIPEAERIQRGQVLGMPGVIPTGTTGTMPSRYESYEDVLARNKAAMGLNQGGRVGYQAGGISMGNTLTQNIAANQAQRMSNQDVLQAARARLPGHTPSSINFQGKVLQQNHFGGPPSGSTPVQQKPFGGPPSGSTPVQQKPYSGETYSSGTAPELPTLTQNYYDQLEGLRTKQRTAGIADENLIPDFGPVGEGMIDLGGERRPTPSGQKAQLDYLTSGVNQGLTYDQIMDNYTNERVARADADIEKYGSFADGRNIDPFSGKSSYNDMLDVFKHDYPHIQLTGNETLAELDQMMLDIQGYNKGGRIGYSTGTDFQKWLQGRQKFDAERSREELYREYLEDKRRQKVAEQKQMVAQGGRVGQMYGTGPQGLPGIPRRAPDGMEFDMRMNGGFQGLGKKEGKDDVPAMLAKNEFVFTADAVRGAGGGDIELGAQKMYDTMKNLEKRVV